MPRVPMTISGSYEAIQRPVQASITRDIIEQLGLAKDIKTLDLTDNAADIQHGGSMEYFEQRPRYQYKLDTESRINISWTENQIPEDALTVTAGRPNHIVVFKDPLLHVDIYPSKQRTELRGDVEIRFKDRDTAMRWWSDTRTRLTMRRAQVSHSIQFHYHVPVAFLVMLNEIYLLREKQGGYGETIQDYFKKHATPNITSVTNQAGKNATIVVKETQHGVLGHFEFGAEPPRPTPRENDGTYEVTFSYWVLYEKPEAMFMNYPYVIHNQLVPEWMIDFEPRYDEDRLLGAQGSIEQDSLKRATEIAGMHMRWGEGYHGISIPAFDDWIPKYMHEGYVGLIRGAIAVNPEDPRQVMDLNDLGAYALSPLLKNFLLDVPASLITLYGGPVSATLYRDYVPLGGETLIVTNDLVLRSKADLDIRRWYHVLLSMNYQIVHYPGRVKEIMRKHGAFCQLFFTSLAPGILQDGYFPTLQPDGSISKIDFDRAATYIFERMPGKLGPGDNHFRVVAAFTINARDMRELK